MSSENNTHQTNSRRSFIATTALASLGVIYGKNILAQTIFFAEKPNSKIAGVQMGVITYSYRSMPHNIQQLLQFIVDSGISAVELMGEAVEEFAGRPADKNQLPDWRAQVSMDKFKEVRKMFEKAGVTIYAFKPSALGANNTDAEIEYAMKAAKALGAKSVTVELPKDAEHSKRLGALALKNRVYVGYHAHTQATDTAWDTALSQSPYNSINLDCGHYIAAGGNNTKETLLAFIEARHERITSMHLKDRQTKDNGAANLVWGEGNTPIKDILGLLKTKKYSIPVSIELEYTIPQGSDAVQEVKKCLAFARKQLEG